MQEQSRSAYLAEWILPISAPPVRDGALIVEAGRIVQVTTAQAVRTNAQHAQHVTDFGKSILMPGLVNVHSHLELTALRGFLEGLEFGRWLRVLTEARSQLFSTDDLYLASVFGIHEGLIAGVTTLGDASATGVPVRALKNCGVRGVVYQEVFGPDPSQCDASMQQLEQAVSALRQHESPLVSVGVSPHAPYTVSVKLFESVARFASTHRLPLSVHVAESAAETDFVRNGTGHFAERLKMRGIAPGKRFRSPVALLEATGILDVEPLLVHAIHVDENDLASIGSTGSRIAHCPVSNAKLGQGIAPLGAMVRQGIRIGLGSDSVASNNRMDILGEARQAVLFNATRPHPLKFDAHEALALATLGGARALGMDHEIGSLEAGKSADVAVFPLDETTFGPVHDPAVALIHTLAGRATAGFVMVAGEPLVEDGVILREEPTLHPGMKAMAAALRTWNTSIPQAMVAQ